jgi:hypothetical protein
MAATGLVFVALASGCGGRSEKTSGEPIVDEREPQCRKYAAWYTTDIDEVTCDFDRDTLSLRCDSVQFGISTTTWATIEDALAENHPIGKIAYSYRSFMMPDVTFTDTISYDDAGRPTSSHPTIVVAPSVENQGFGSDSFEYTAWDAEKRPTRATVTLVVEGPALPPTGCGGQEETYEYDDANRKYVVARTVGGGPLCRGIVRTWIFDADGIVIEEARQFVEPGVIIVPYTTLEIGEICRD